MLSTPEDGQRHGDDLSAKGRSGVRRLDFGLDLCQILLNDDSSRSPEKMMNAFIQANK